jgi:3alpha(or 20beta)-hydroxysteroid dehydrogenase
LWTFRAEIVAEGVEPSKPAASLGGRRSATREAEVGRLDGKVAVVTGAARGQGEAEARAFVDEGAAVVAADVIDDGIRAVASELGGRALPVHLDVTRPEDWERAVALAEEAFGPVTVLVNNAAIIRRGGVADTSLEDYLGVVMVNQVGCFLGMRAVCPSMKKAGGGSIVNVSSTSGLTGYTDVIAYVGSKWAVRGMTKAAALELGPHNIRVNSIHPGAIDTPMTNPSGLDHSIISERYSFLPLGRVGDPAEIARLAVFLASEDSSFSTGAEFVADGGRTAGFRS